MNELTRLRHQQPTRAGRLWTVMLVLVVLMMPVVIYADKPNPSLESTVELAGPINTPEGVEITDMVGRLRAEGVAPGDILRVAMDLLRLRQVYRVTKTQQVELFVNHPQLAQFAERYRAYPWAFHWVDEWELVLAPSPDTPGAPLTDLASVVAVLQANTHPSLTCAINLEIAAEPAEVLPQVGHIKRLGVSASTGASTLARLLRMIDFPQLGQVRAYNLTICRLDILGALGNRHLETIMFIDLDLSTPVTAPLGVLGLTATRFELATFGEKKLPTPKLSTLKAVLQLLQRQTVTMAPLDLVLQIYLADMEFRVFFGRSLVVQITGEPSLSQAIEAALSGTASSSQITRAARRQRVKYFSEIQLWALSSVEDKPAVLARAKLLLEHTLMVPRGIVKY